MKRRFGLAMVIALLVSILACAPAASPSPSPTRTGGPSPSPTAKPLRVGLVTDVGGLDDKSFNTLANKGLTDAKSQLGAEGNVIESKEQANYVPNLTNFAQQGYDLVIAVGFLMVNATWKVAKQFPNVKFAIVDGAPADDAGKTENLPNVSNLFFKEQESGYIAGIIAGEMLKAKIGKATTGKACTMGGIPIPPVDRFIAGYQDALGKYNITPLLAYSQSFTDQQKGKEIGLQHISQGCSVLFQVAGQSGLGYLTAAKEKNFYGIGVDADQAFFAPETVLTSAVKKVDRAVFLTIQSVKDGAFKSGDNIFDANKDATGYGTLHKDVPAAVKAAADAALADIKSGKIKPSDTIKK